MQAGSIEAQILRARWMRHIHTMSYIHIASNPGSWVRAHTCMHKNTCTWVDVKKLTQCSINPIGMRLAGRSESLLSSLMVPIALAKLYNTFALPNDFRCCIAATASSKKSPGRFILKFDATYDLNRSEIMCNSWLGVVSGERCNSGIICISLVDFLQLAYGGNNVLQLKLGTWISYKDNLVLCCDKHFLFRIQKKVCHIYPHDHGRIPVRMLWSGMQLETNIAADAQNWDILMAGQLSWCPWHLT